MKNLINIFLLVILISSVLFSQSIKCNYCGRNIEGEYIVVDGKPFHKNHFKCSNCGKPIKGEYASKNNHYYDKECFTKLFALKCSVCGEPINGKYLIDSYGLKYHKYHEKESRRCDNCNRLISIKTTNGSVKYVDGRTICKICYNKRITSNKDYNSSLNNVIIRLKNYGMGFANSNIELKIVNLLELQSISGNEHSKSIQGYTRTKVIVEGNVKSYQHIIYILGDIPPKYAESTIAHELMHVWISENINHKLEKQFEEGSCNYISYTYLKSDYSDDAQDIIEIIKRNPDRIYGDGFRKVYERFKGRDFTIFLNYLKENSSI